MMDAERDITRYERTLREWADLTRKQSKANVPRANALADELQALYLRLRETPDGRGGIEALASDPDRLVRLSAAAHCLKWNASLGRSALEEIRDGGGTDGPGWDIAGFDAKWTLKTLDDGKLDLDWRPRGK
jgi:hypothetical protein